MHSVVTKEIRLSPARYVKVAMGVWLSRWWWAVMLPIAGLAVMAVADWRYLLAIFALVCVVYPALMMMMYFSHALRPEAAFSTIPHTIRIDKDCVTVTYHVDEDDSRHCPKPRVVPMAQVLRADVEGSSLLIWLRSGDYDFIEIPFSALEEAHREILFEIIGFNNA